MALSVDQEFAERFDEAAGLYNDDKLEECIEVAQAIIDDGACPRFYRMRTLALLGGVVGDWYDAVKYCEQADTLWRIIQRWRREGEGEEADKMMVEARRHIDELEAVLQLEAPQPYDSGEDNADLMAPPLPDDADETAEHHVGFLEENSSDEGLSRETDDESENEDTAVVAA